MKKKENYNYFTELITITEHIVKSAETLKNVIENFNLEKLNMEIHEVHGLENEADKIVHTMRNNLVKDFLPPIDREDIALISHKLDNIEDGIDEVLINIKILDITEIREEVIELVNILLSSCKVVQEIFVAFNNLKNLELVSQKVIDVNQLEEKGDRAYEKLMTSLYKTEKNSINLIKWSSIYNCLEETIDSCEEIADSMQDVVMKNS
ncbi:MAG: DUF47 family protein [Clostridia bacterium]|nr:DUF47 family protein [Clostridia bacterium]